MKEKREQKKDRGPPKPKEAAKPEVASQEDAPQDAPLYDSTPFTSGVPYAQEYCQNFDFSGFPPLCRETYQTLTGFNPRLTRDMTYPGLFQSMNTLLQTAIVDSVFEEGVRPIPGYDTRAQDILPTEYVIPGPIYEYLTNISNVMTPGNQEVKVNLPDIMFPQEAYIDEEDIEIPAGTFGPVDDETHNVYETQVSPYTTMQYVVESALDRDRGDPRDWNPLPEQLVPEGGVPTRDFLGYEEIPVLHAEGKEVLRTGRFEDGEGVAGRIRYNAGIFLKCNAELSRLMDKMKMIKLGLDKGIRKYIKFKTNPGNLIFCEAIDPAPPQNSRMVRLMSNFAYGTNAAGSAGILTLHRRRTENAPGCCYLFNAAPAPNWVETRNALFEMQEPYAPLCFFFNSYC